MDGPKPGGKSRRRPSASDLTASARNRLSNRDWVNPHDPEARVTKMKDGRTHLAYKAEHAVDLETGAVVAVTLQGADKGDTTTFHETLVEAGNTVADLAMRDVQLHPNDESKVNLNGIEQIVADMGYHSGSVLTSVEDREVRSYIPEKKQRGRRHWQGKGEEQKAVYANRRRVCGAYGKKLLKRRGELVERSFAHCYETGGMRRTHLRGHANILKRQLIHVGAFNLSLVMRKLLGAGTPRELRNRFGTRLLRHILRSAPPFLRFAFRARKNRFALHRDAVQCVRQATGSRLQLRGLICRKSATYTTGC